MTACWFINKLDSSYILSHDSVQAFDQQGAEIFDEPVPAQSKVEGFKSSV